MIVIVRATLAFSKDDS